MNVTDLARAAQDGMSLPDWATVASPIVATAAAIIALLGAMSTRASMRIAKQQEERRHHRLDLYLSDATASRADDRRILSCAVVITNPADSPNTLVSIDLHVNLVRADGTIVKIKVSPSAATAADGAQAQALNPPAPIGARSAVAGRIDFDVLDEVIGPNRVDQYQLVMQDTDQRTETIDIAVFREVLQESDETDT